MKKIAPFSIFLALFLLLAGCGSKYTLCAEIPAYNRMIIRNDTSLTIEDGRVEIQNQTDADATCYAYAADSKTAAASVDVPAKGKAELTGLTPGEYIFGIGAQVSEQTEIEMILSLP